MCCMFMFHYLLENEQSWNITCENINKLLKKDGYLLITCFDAHRVANLLKNNNGVINLEERKKKKKISIIVFKNYLMIIKMFMNMVIKLMLKYVLLWIIIMLNI